MKPGFLGHDRPEHMPDRRGTDDPTTRRLLEQTLAKEEEHAELLQGVIPARRVAPGAAPTG